MAYATGKHSVGMCQRCGMVYKYSQLRKDGYTTSLVCPPCYDIAHPAEKPVRLSEGIALRRPAPDLDATASRVIDDDRPLGEVLGFDNYFGEHS